MTTIAFIIGLVIGILIGYFIGNRNPKEDPISGQDPDHNFTDREIDQINDDLLKVDGAYRFPNPETGESMRYISFMDSLLMNLNPRNNAILVDHCKNIDTAIRLLEVRKKDENDGVGFSAEEREDLLRQFKAGKPFPHSAFKETCPPPKGDDDDGDWWAGVATKTVANLVPEMKVEVTLIDPAKNSYKIEPQGALYDLNPVLLKINQSGRFIISYKITDLELGKTSSFEQQFNYKVPSE